MVLPITADIALQAFELPASYPKDPADRIIGATALIEGLSACDRRPRNPQFECRADNLVNLAFVSISLTFLFPRESA